MSDVIMLSVQELATKLCVNPETVRRWIRSGELQTELKKRTENNEHTPES